MAMVHRYLCLLLVASFLLARAHAQINYFPGFGAGGFGGPFKGSQGDNNDGGEDEEATGGGGGGGQGPPQGNFETNYEGEWELVAKSSGTVAMHLQILNNNKAIMLDSTNFSPTQIQLEPGNCRPFVDQAGKQQIDCWAHAVEYDLDTNNIRPLKVVTNPWCSSGGVDPQGNLVQTGGWFEGGRGVRYLEPCDTCDFEEFPDSLSVQRWYGSQSILPDGGFIVIGGRRGFSWEYVPPKGQKNDPATGNIPMPFLEQTTDQMENNLYPFVHVSTDGNLFIFANTKSILYNIETKQIVRTFPDIKGGSRNYPASGSSALLPIRLRGNPDDAIPAEVMICGGNTKEAAALAEKKNFLVADKTCARLLITDPNPQWVMEDMPGPRTMCDLLNLPNGELLLINGAKVGVSGWDLAEDPYSAPVVYNPDKPQGTRFKELAPSTIPRMYHSTSAVLPDGRILVAGSHTHLTYDYQAKYPTELRVEKFTPHYLDPTLDAHRPEIQKVSQKQLKYGGTFEVQFRLDDADVANEDIVVNMYAPPWTTHGYSMSQRLVELNNEKLTPAGGGYSVEAFAPPSSNIAPPGYYYLHVVHRGVPSKAIWVHIK